MKHDIISSAIFKTKLTQNIIYVKQTNDFCLICLNFTYLCVNKITEEILNEKWKYHKHPFVCTWPS